MSPRSLPFSHCNNKWQGPFKCAVSVAAKSLSVLRLMACFLPVCTGLTRLRLLYRESQAAAYELIMDWSLEEHKALRLQVPKTGLQTPFRGGKVQDIAQKVLLPPCYLLLLCPPWGLLAAYRYAAVKSAPQS